MNAIVTPPSIGLVTLKRLVIGWWWRRRCRHHPTATICDSIGAGGSCTRMPAPLSLYQPARREVSNQLYGRTVPALHQHGLNQIVLCALPLSCCSLIAYLDRSTQVMGASSRWGGQPLKLQARSATDNNLLRNAYSHPGRHARGSRGNAGPARRASSNTNSPF